MAGEFAEEKKVGISAGNVKPKKLIGRKECQLVTFDLPYLAFYYNHKLIIYKGGDGFDGLWRNRLAAVLEEFYQLAGKLDKVDEDGVFRVVSDDDMEGVEMVAAAAEEVETAEQGSRSLRNCCLTTGS